MESGGGIKKYILYIYVHNAYPLIRQPTLAGQPGLVEPGSLSFNSIQKKLYWHEQYTFALPKQVTHKIKRSGKKG